MKLENIDEKDLRINPVDLWKNQWLLLTSGDFTAHQFNCMTIAWGSIGCMWNKPFIQVVVRPTRYTIEFIENYPDFTVCGFPELYRKALQLLGSRSGRNEDKIASAGLTPCASSTISAPAFHEADLIFECRKIYSNQFTPESFIDPSIDKLYSEMDYHKIYFGEILKISGDIKKYT